MSNITTIPIKSKTKNIEKSIIKSNLSAVKKERLIEYFKCKNDPVYFIENYIKLAEVGGDRCVNLYDKQKEFIHEVFNIHHIITLKSRQTGLSTVTQMCCAYVMTFYKNAVIGVISKGGAESTDFCRIVMGMIDTVPEWMRPEFVKRREQTAILDNGCKLFASQVNEANPEGTLRGKAMNILVIDEASFITKIDEAYTSCAPTLVKAQQIARQKGIPYATIIISTPNKTVGRGKWYYQTWTAALSDTSIFHPFRLHWKDIPEYADDPEWYETQCGLLENIPWKIAQELNMQFVASNDSFFSTEIIEILNDISQTIVSKLKFYAYDLKLFSQFDPNAFYLIGVDSASEGGNDSSTIVVMDFETMEQVAEYKAEHIRVEDFCQVVARVSDVYSNNLIIVESNSYGNQVCEYLTRSNTYYNVYKSKRVSKDIGKSGKPSYSYGLYTGPTSRPLIIDALYSVIESNPQVVKSEALAMELIGLVDKRNKIQADDGEHDDLVMAFAFCCYVRQYDPPMGMKMKFTAPNDVSDMNEIAAYNDGIGLNLMTQPSQDIDVEDLSWADRLHVNDASNKQLNQYMKNNLSKIMSESQSNEIDVLSMINGFNRKT